MRYSTAGDTVAANAQPILIDCHRGPIALAHNGNLVNATVLRQELEAAGSIFQSTADTEVILHLYARSHRERLEDAIAASLSKVMGAFSLLFLTRDALVAARDPWGFRPLVIGKLEGATHRLLRDLRPRPHRRGVRARGRARRDGRRRPRTGCARSAPSRRSPSRQCVFEHVYFARPDSLVFGENVLTSRGSPSAASSPARPPPTRTSSCPSPTAGSAPPSATPRRAACPIEWGLIRNHYVGRTFIEPKQSIRSFGVQDQAEPRARDPGGQARGPHRRLDRPRDDVAQDRADGAGRRARGRSTSASRSPPTTGPCYYGIDTPLQERAHRLVAQRGRDREDSIGADSLAYLSHEGLLAAVGDAAGTRHCTACFSGNYPVAVTQAEDWQLKLFEKVRA